MPATSYPKAQTTSVNTVGDLEVVDDLTIDANGIIPTDDSDMPIGSSTKRFTEGWYDGPLVVDPAGDAVQADAGTDADDLILGNNSAATATGLTLLTTAAGTAKLAFGDDSDADAGSLQYLHGSNRLDAYTGGTKRLELGSSGLTLKGTGSDLVVEGTGTSTFAGLSQARRFLSVTTGDTDVGLNINRASATGRSQIRLNDENGSEVWRLGMTGGGGDDFSFFNGVDGVITLTHATGDVSLANDLKVSGTAATISSGTGSPEGAVTAPVGSIFTRTDGGAGTSFYVKESGSGNTGWAAK